MLRLQLRRKSEIELYEYASAMVSYDRVCATISQDLLFMQRPRQSRQERVHLLGSALVQPSSSGTIHSNNRGGTVAEAAAAAVTSSGLLLTSSGEKYGLLSLISSANSLSQEQSSSSSSSSSSSQSWCLACGQPLLQSRNDLEEAGRVCSSAPSVVPHSSRAVDNSPTAQLTKQEFELLKSCVVDHRKGSCIDWNEVLAAWNNAVSENKPGIYQREMQRLQTAWKNKMQGLKGKKAATSSENQASTINISSRSSGSSSSSGYSSRSLPQTGHQVQLPVSVVMRPDGTAIRSVLGGSMAASVALGSHPTRQERSGDLSTGEHAVVKKVAEDRLRLGLGMCRKAVMYEYHRVFPGYTRNHVKLMGYWKSYKDGAAWRDVVARVAKEKHQKSQPET